MNHTRKLNLVFLGLLLFAFPLGAAERYFGEPVQLKGPALYFTSWKYARQGSFSWRVQVDATASEGERNIGAWPKGEKVPFKDGGLVVQVFDEDKYKAWDVVPSGS